MNALIDPRALTRRVPRFGAIGIPRGWFVVAFSEEIVAGDIHAMHYFGRDLAAYRGESGRAFVVDAYCPHLGANLAHGGKVEGDCIRCPFHGWRFDGDGRCVEIPYTDKLPPKARLGAMPVREQNGVVMAFFDPSGRADVTPWDIPVLDEEGWTPGRTITWRGLTTHPQEVFENTVDTAHIGPIHDGRGAALIGKPSFDGEKLHVDIEFQAPGAVVGMPDTLNDVHLSVTLRGLGWVQVQTHVRNVDVRARQRIYVTPIDEESVDIRAVVHVQPTDDAKFTAELAEIFYTAYVEDFAKDFPIWENKRYLAKPQLAKGDGPIGAYRNWCTQFYEPRTQVKAALEASAARSAWSAFRDRVAQLRERLVSRVTEPKSVGRPVVSAAQAADPVRRVQTATEYFETLGDRFVPTAARGVDAIFQWELSGEGGRTFHARVQDGAIHIAQGAHEAPSVSLVMPAADYVRVVNGELDGMRAFTSGRGKVRGSLPLAMKMRTLFPA